jgi:hypothetical protein
MNIQCTKQYVLATILFFLSINLQANQYEVHSKPAILSIFSKYGHFKGVTMLEASKELLQQYKIKQFKSIIFEKITDNQLAEIRIEIEKDKKEALKIKEIIQDGLLMSGYYKLKTEDEKMNRYLIFKVSASKKTTLVYVEGELTPEELIDLLK